MVDRRAKYGYKLVRNRAKDWHYSEVCVADDEARPEDHGPCRYFTWRLKWENRGEHSYMTGAGAFEPRLFL